MEKAGGLWHNAFMDSLWDTHVHLDAMFSPVQAARRADQQGVRTWVLVASSPDAYHQQSRLLAQGILSPIRYVRTVGLHPEIAHADGALQALRDIMERGSVAAIGEIGLPAYSFLTREAFNRNWEWLYIQLSWAEARQLPVIVHAVHAGCEPMLRILEEFPGIRQVVFHWLKAPAEAVQEAASRRYYVGITPDILWRGRDQTLFTQVPPNLVLLETDAPFPHRPHNFRGEPHEIAELVRFLDSFAPQPGGWGELSVLNAQRFFGWAGQ